jgi:hypothetical protein
LLPPSLTILLAVSKLVLFEIASLLLPDDECSKFKTYFILYVHPISQIGLVPSWLSDLVHVSWFVFFGIDYLCYFLYSASFFCRTFKLLWSMWPCLIFSPSLFILLILLLLPGDEHTYYKKKCCWYFYLVTWNYIINLTYLKTFTITKHGHNLFVFYNNFLYLLIQHKIWILDCISSLLTSRSGRCGMISFLD